MISVLMRIESVELIRDADLKDETVEVAVKFSCETPLNEIDTCYMFTLYFGEVYYEVSDEDYFIRKGSLSEMGGNMRLVGSEKSLCLKSGDSVVIPITSDFQDEIKKGLYDPDVETSVDKLVKREFGKFSIRTEFLFINSGACLRFCVQT
ncbi:hypothetical protein D6T51_10615 [Salmonella enterica subsp. enterica serovar Muenchen]|nr:hypothetical protein [Salmonella enterica subsp. enterica serovar Muenchen]